MMNTKVIEVINQLQTVAPEIWNAAIVDSYLSAGGYACWAVLLFAGFFGARKYAKTMLKSCVEVKIGSGLVQGLFLFVAIAFSYESLSHLISAELHAYESLLQGFK